MNRLSRLEILYGIISPKINKLSPKITELSPKVMQTSPKINKLSPQIMQISPKDMQTSPKVSIQQHALKGQKLLAQGNTLGIR